jgi:hypothetical protein
MIATASFHQSRHLLFTLIAFSSSATFQESDSTRYETNGNSKPVMKPFQI